MNSDTWTKNKSNHENTKSKKHENILGLVRDFVLS